MADGPSIDRNLDLTDPNVPTCALTLTVRWPVDERLGQLAELVNTEKLGPTTKVELASALIQTAEPNPLWLFDKVMHYRRATVGDAAFWIPDEVDPVPFEARKPGRKGK